MNPIIEKIANLITSLGTVIFVLLMTVIAMIFVGHGLYYQVFLKNMAPWQADVAAWVLSFGVETTVLVITCNVKYFSSRQLPVFFAICSGFIVLFFIQAFDMNQSAIDLAIRWFIGLLVAGVNYVYSELFVKKYNDEKYKTDLLGEIKILNQKNSESNLELESVKNDLERSKQDVERLVDYVAELEVFKKKELDKVTCSFCHQVFKSVYHLASHRTNCEMNPKKGERDSVFEAVV